MVPRVLSSEKTQNKKGLMVLFFCSTTIVNLLREREREREGLILHAIVIFLYTENKWCYILLPLPTKKARILCLDSL